MPRFGPKQRKRFTSEEHFLAYRLAKERKKHMEWDYSWKSMGYGEKSKKSLDAILSEITPQSLIEQARKTLATQEADSALKDSRGMPRTVLDVLRGNWRKATVWGIGSEPHKGYVPESRRERRIIPAEK